MMRCGVEKDAHIGTKKSLEQPPHPQNTNENVNRSGFSRPATSPPAFVSFSLAHIRALMQSVYSHIMNSVQIWRA